MYNWNATYQAKVSGLHQNQFQRRVNANVYYSPGVDRIFAVDTLDPYTSLEIAQILSGKMPAIAVLVLSKNDTMDINNFNCIEYTIKNKNPVVGHAALLFSRQMPVLRRFENNELIKETAFPPDYDNNENLNTFLMFHEYAKFTIRAWHAAKTTDSIHNWLPMNRYAQDFFLDCLPQDFSTPHDNLNSASSIGVIAEIKKILYFSDSIEEALDQIADVWRNNDTPLSQHWRQRFYALLEGPEPPADLKNSTGDQDRYSGFLL